MKYLVIALALLGSTSAFAGQKLTDRHECVQYHGNWVNAPTVSCDALFMGNTGGQAGNATPKKK